MTAGNVVVLSRTVGSDDILGATERIPRRLALTGSEGAELRAGSLPVEEDRTPADAGLVSWRETIYAAFAGGGTGNVSRRGGDAVAVVGGPGRVCITSASSSRLTPTSAFTGTRDSAFTSGPHGHESRWARRSSSAPLSRPTLTSSDSSTCLWRWPFVPSPVW